MNRLHNPETNGLIIWVTNLNFNSKEILTLIEHSEKLLFMRIFLITFLILIFNLQTWTNADDIKDFEIEGMSIGDSLLNYYSTNEISEMRTVIFNDYEKHLNNDELFVW